MSLPPQKKREMLFLLLFSFDMGKAEDVELIPFLMGQLSVSKKYAREAFEGAQRIWGQRQELDQCITEKSRNYAFNRIKAVEKNVLRLAVYELMEQKLSLKIIIAEAHRLTRKFGTIEGASFVNALLEEIHASNTSISTSERQALK